MDKLNRLPFSGVEAKEISRWVSSSERTVATGFDASREILLDDSLRPFRILHLAVHALLNESRPDLSGLALSLIDEQGQDIDGFLRLYEIYGFDLDHELVVLSACRTAVGPEIRGEGLVGLSRGFLYGGADSVIGSLWQVDDRATAELMGFFLPRVAGK